MTQTGSKLSYGVKHIVHAFLPVVTLAILAGVAPMSQATAATAEKSGSVGDTSIRPFKVHVPDADLKDLRQRIKATRWPDKETVPDRSQGAPLERMQALMSYWGTGYDWRKVEARLNALPQFTTKIDGVDIYFIHVRSKYTNA